MPRYNMCEFCWLQQHAYPANFAINFRGVLDICSYCGRANRDGIYVRETRQQPATDRKKDGSNEPPFDAGAD